MFTMSRIAIAASLAIGLLGQAEVAAESLDALDQPIAPGEAPSHAEIDARYGWLVLTQLDDMRAALARSDLVEARSIGARATRELRLLHALQSDPSSTARLAVMQADHVLIARTIGATLSSTEARLGDADVALKGNDVRAAIEIVTDAAGALRTALVALDEQLHAQDPATIKSGRLP